MFHCFFYSNAVLLFGVVSELKRRGGDSALTGQLREQLRDLLSLAGTWGFRRGTWGEDADWGATDLLAFNEFNEDIAKVINIILITY